MRMPTATVLPVRALENKLERPLEEFILRTQPRKATLIKPEPEKNPAAREPFGFD